MAKTLAEAIGRMIFDRTLDTLLNPNTPVKDADAPIVARKVEEAIKPVVVNATNSEPWFQSRVLLGSFAANLAAIADLLAMFASGEFDVGRAAPSIAVILGTAVAIYGRLRGSKLKPLGQ